MKKKNGSIGELIGIVTFFLLFSPGCTPAPEANPEQTPTPPVNLTQELIKQNQQLKKADTMLLERIGRLEMQRKSDRSRYERRLKRMDKTISLLESNIREIEKSTLKPTTRTKAKLRTSTKSKSLKKKQTAVTEDSTGKVSSPQGMAREMRIPDNSRAIETVSLLPSSATVSTKRKAEAGKKAKSPGKPFAAVPSAKKKKPVATREIWEDPDLKPPISPIRFKTVPGAKRLYQKAFKLYSSNSHSEAIREFESFLRRYPSDFDADNSQFWIGQAYFRLNNYLQAELAFRRVLKNYQHKETKRGYKTPDAILMLGQIYLIRKKPIKARYYFQHVVERFPETRSAVKAQSEIKAMNPF